ncbi:hypothetical protein SAMN05216419_100170 [Nitrosomonas cryotolerans]|uniref:Lipoprotein n=1 Tax=Nitrosomonas cryotolerans ATCC 49181 TaxID=1131553 RepID=A0A1N6IQN2_9PROT|nr:hypothetical protein [Nitrosomonas cryotolerans]SFP34433.1 hypothetical protein SAMN05216419_100170 [Nitrosomonas cryotolerans]SIO34308.1 hypothetical protein SAMN02743940_1995 [Nitrosomonas cryotolerans ATCC 49181]
MRITNCFCLIIFLITLPLLSGCWLAVAAGAGAYGGYKMKEKDKIRLLKKKTVKRNLTDYL